MQANVNEAGNTPEIPPAENEPENETVEPQQMVTRNQLWLNSRNFLKLHQLAGLDRNTVPILGDWNKDGKPDLLLGSASGKIYGYENRG